MPTTRVNFPDATVAIAITLLVLPLVDLAADPRSGEDTGDLLTEHWPAFVAFVVTFWQPLLPDSFRPAMVPMLVAAEGKRAEGPGKPAELWRRLTDPHPS